MTTAINGNIESLTANRAGCSPRYSSRITGIFLTLACALLVAAAQATTPAMPEVLAATDAYVPDPSFNGGLFGLDHFAAANSLDQAGLVTAQLANGDMVVAGLVPDGVAGGFCLDGTKLCSIGLVRYDATGQRRTWTNPGAGGRFTNQYVVYPANPANLRYQYLRDVKVRGNLIDALVDVPESDGVVRAGFRNVDVVTFRDDGS